MIYFPSLIIIFQHLLQIRSLIENLPCELCVGDNPPVSIVLQGALTDVKQLAHITVVQRTSAAIATASTTPLISLNAVNEQVTTIEAIDFENVSVTGLKKALFYSSAKDYLITNFNIVNSLVEQAGDATTIDFTKGSGAKTLTIENSTIWGNVPSAGTTTKSMYSSQGGQKLTEIEENSTQTFNIKNSTFYNLAKTKNFWSHRSSNQSWLVYNVENSVFVDCGKSGQVIKGLNGGQGGANPTWNISGNLFNFDGVNTGENEVTGDTNEPVKNSVGGVATITSTAEGLTVSIPSSVGDPRWLK